MGHVVKRLVDSICDDLAKGDHYDVDYNHTPSQFRRREFLDVHGSDACCDAYTDTDQEPVSNLESVNVRVWNLVRVAEVGSGSGHTIDHTSWHTACPTAPPMKIISAIPSTRRRPV